MGAGSGTYNRKLLSLLVILNYQNYQLSLHVGSLNLCTKIINDIGSDQHLSSRF